jgi:UDP-N-acetylmuramoyl-L-alanyl-D-glutamate--2,6-diaminopimelate ligase
MVVVDYAHKPDALAQVLDTLRPYATGRLVSVFGCGGDRDRTKRPLMGAVASRLSDFVVLTSDNPRSEDPDRILDEIRRGLAPAAAPGAPPRPSTPFLTIPDRKAAIERAIRSAQPDDLVIIAGKGHEKYQVIGDRTLPFDDVEIARAALGQRRAAPRV